MERSSASRTAGVVVRTVTMGSEEYLLSNPDRVRKAADEEAVVIARRLDMLAALARACEALPEASRAQWRQDYIQKMLCGIASPEEWSAYYRSIWRLAFRFWNALDEKHKILPGDPGDQWARPPRPAIPPRRMTLLEGVSWAYELVNREDVGRAQVDSLELALEAVSQADATKNSSSGSTDQAATQATDTQSTEGGQPSTPTS
jgi:hypothetical protein